jgi:hypothetical protein
VHTLDELERRGVEIAGRFEIPPGPAVELISPGPQRPALYELTRPETLARLAGRTRLLRLVPRRRQPRVFAPYEQPIPSPLESR